MGPYRPGQRLSARRLNADAEQARRLARTAGGGAGTGVRNTPGGAGPVDLGRRPVWARIDATPGAAGSGLGGSGAASDGCAEPGYAWTEMGDDGCGAMVEMTDGVVSDGADGRQLYEVNGDYLVPPGTVVKAWPAFGGETYLFQSFAGGWVRITSAAPDPCDAAGSGAGTPVNDCSPCADGGAAYSWEAVEPAACGGWESFFGSPSGTNGSDQPDGVPLNPLYEANGDRTVPEGTIVWAVLGHRYTADDLSGSGPEECSPVRDYRFARPASSPGCQEEAPGSGEDCCMDGERFFSCEVTIPFVRMLDDGTCCQGEVTLTFPAPIPICLRDCDAGSGAVPGSGG